MSNETEHSVGPGVTGALDGLFAEAIQAQQGISDTSLYDQLQTIDKRYSALDVVDRGGVKEIRHAEDHVTGRRLAMAVRHSCGDNHDHEAFLREARITANLQHPNIIPVYDMGVDEHGEAFFTMKLIEGDNLATLLKSDCRPSLPEMLDIVDKVCDAVAFAHSRGVIHLDLKPANIQVSGYGEVLVCDWGLAKILDAACEDVYLEQYSFDDVERRSLTLDGKVKGTPGYMAPEQSGAFRGAKDQRTDIYALGAMLFEIATGRLLVIGDTVDVMLRNTARGHCRVVPSTVPDGLAAIIRKATAHQPDHRYQKATELQSDIRHYIHGYATDAEAAGGYRQLKLFIQRNRNACIAALLTTALVSALVGAFIQQLSDSRDALSESRDATQAERAERLRVGRDAAPDFLRRAKAAYGKGRLEEAEAHATTTLSLNPDLYEARNVLARVHVSRGNFPKALSLFSEPLEPLDKVLREVIARYPDKPSVARMPVPPALQLLAAIEAAGSAEAVVLLRELEDGTNRKFRDEVYVAAAQWPYVEHCLIILDIAESCSIQSHREAIIAQVLWLLESNRWDGSQQAARRAVHLTKKRDVQRRLHIFLHGNLLGGRPVVATQSGSRAPTAMVDGDKRETRCWTTERLPVSITIDLEASYYINHFVAYLGSNDAIHYRIEAAGADKAFGVAYDSGEAVAVKEKSISHRFPRVNARYLRFSVVGAKTQRAAIAELEASYQLGNLALHRPVESHPPTEDDRLGIVLDGDTGMDHHWTSRAAQTSVTIDLGAVYEIDETRVYVHYDGARDYQYRVSLSKDGSQYHDVVDRLTNKTSAPADPLIDRFERTEARFVRLTAIQSADTADGAVHVREIEVFESRHW